LFEAYHISCQLNASTFDVNWMQAFIIEGKNIYSIEGNKRASQTAKEIPWS